GVSPCFGMPPLYDLAIDPTLNFTGLDLQKETVPVAGGGLVDEVTISWDAYPDDAGLACVAVYRFDGEGNQVSAGTEYLFSQGQTSFTTSPVTDSTGGTVCYQLYALTATSRSEVAELCTEIEHPRAPGMTPAAPIQGTTPVSSPVPLTV